MHYHTHLSLETGALLATIWLILLGTLLRSSPIVLAWLAVRFVMRAMLAILLGPLLKSAAIALTLTLVVASATQVPAAAGTSASVVAASAAPVSANFDPSVTEAFLRVTGKSKRPMPVWLLESAARIYTAYKNGQKVEEAARMAHVALAEIATVRAEVDAGRALTEKEQRVTRARLEAQTALLEGLEGRVTRVETRTGQLERRANQVMRIVTRRGCPQLHAWDRKLRRCTNRQ